MHAYASQTAHLACIRHNAARMHATSAPDFRLYPSNALDTLAALLAEELRRPVPEQPVLQPEVVLIPQVAMRRWLQSTLAAEHGVAANLNSSRPANSSRARWSAISARPTTT